MIARTWRGSSRSEHAGAYLAHLNEKTLPGIAGMSGHRGAYVLSRTNGHLVEFTVITLWESLEAIARFAGDDLEVAVVPPEARALLDSYDTRAVHWTIALQSTPG